MAVLTTAALFLSTKYMCLIIVILFLLFVTAISGIKRQVIFKNLAAYLILILLPYSIGLLISVLFNSFNTNIGKAAFNMLKLFLVWHIGSLYLYTTPIKSTVGLLDKIFSPLKLLGLPITKYAISISYIISQLPQAVSEFLSTFAHQVKLTIKDKKRDFKKVSNEISDILVSFIVSSFDKTEKVQKQISQTNTQDLCEYNFKFSKNDAIAAASFIVFMVLFFIMSL
jgi:energy-coupling factor transport system permease protein